MCLNLSLPAAFSHCARACQAQVELIGFCPAAKVGARWPSNAAAKLVEFAFNAGGCHAHSPPQVYKEIKHQATTHPPIFHLGASAVRCFPATYTWSHHNLLPKI